jgi:hypothetical protein
MNKIKEITIIQDTNNLIITKIQVQFQNIKNRS